MGLQGTTFLTRAARTPRWVSLASAASEPLSVSAESGQRPWRLWRWSNERRVRSTALRCSPNDGRAELLATSLWLALRAACGVQIGNPADLVARPCAQTVGAFPDIRLRFSAPPTAPGSSASLPAIRGLGRSKTLQFASWTLRARCAQSAPPGIRERTRSAWMREGRVRGVAFSLVTFSWPRKRKSHARPGGARNPTWMSVLHDDSLGQWIPACAGMTKHDEPRRDGAPVRPSATFPRTQGKDSTAKAIP